MNSNYQYYVNKSSQGSSGKNCMCVRPVVKDRNYDYLLRNNYLSEYSTEEDQYEVLYNLGILQRLTKLKQIIDAKVIQSESIPWDIEPTAGNTEHILSSDALKTEFLKYYTKTQIDNLIQEIWTNLLRETSITDIQNSIQALTERVETLEQNPGSSVDSIKHIILTQEEYDSLEEPEPNVLYIIVEKTSSKFGDPFPFTLD